MVDEQSVSWIGAVARDQLERETSAVVSGVTSRGVFLTLPGERVIFLSGEAYRGPLTLNLRAGLQGVTRPPMHSTVRIEIDGLIFDDRQRVSLARARPWSAPPVGERLAAQAIAARLMATAHIALDGRKTCLLDAVLPDLRSSSPGSGVDSTWPPLLEAVWATAAAGSIQALSVVLIPFLGRGGGLTPSGDDFVLGALLALSRWGAGAPGPDLPVALRRKTTTLSACLIECAAAGEADERVISALDGIAGGVVDEETCARRLCSWGATSGTDALAGMLVGLCTIMPELIEFL